MYYISWNFIMKFSVPTRTSDALDLHNFKVIFTTFVKVFISWQESDIQPDLYHAVNHWIGTEPLKEKYTQFHLTVKIKD